jgi:hypothetical protein
MNAARRHAGRCGGHRPQGRKDLSTGDRGSNCRPSMGRAHQQADARYETRPTPPFTALVCRGTATCFKSLIDSSGQINFLAAPSMTWPCLVAAGRELDCGADFAGEHQPAPERAARVSAEQVRRILPLPRAKILERLERQGYPELLRSPQPLRTFSRPSPDSQRVSDTALPGRYSSREGRGSVRPWPTQKIWPRQFDSAPLRSRDLA